MKEEFYKNELEIRNWLNLYDIKKYELIPDRKYGFVINVSEKVDLSFKALN